LRPLLPLAHTSTDTSVIITIINAYDIRLSASLIHELGLTVAGILTLGSTSAMMTEYDVGDDDGDVMMMIPVTHSLTHSPTAVV